MWGSKAGSRRRGWTRVSLVAQLAVLSAAAFGIFGEPREVAAQQVCHLDTFHISALWSDGSPANVHMETQNCSSVTATLNGLATTQLTDHNGGHVAFNPLQTTALLWGSDRCLGSQIQGQGMWTNRFSANATAYGWFWSGQATGSGSYYNCSELYPHEYRIQSSHYFYNYNWSTYWVRSLDYPY